jgi:hypothetical protein
MILELEETATACAGLLDGIENMNLGEARGHLISIREMVTKALTKRIFMYVPKEYIKWVPPVEEHEVQEAIRKGIGAPYLAPFEYAVYKKFRSAREDAVQAIQCIVAGVSTAAVFHLMRAVEQGIRALGKDLGLRRIRSVVRKTGKIKLLPIEHATWEMMHDQLRCKVDKKLKPLRPGPTRDEKELFYNSILNAFRGFKEAWRNHVMHTRDTYNPKQADIIFSDVSRFMQTLASRVSE